MPYISRARRAKLDPWIESLTKCHLSSGEVNYVISRILFLWSELSKSYAIYNAVMGVLDCVKQEFYRKVIAPYEDRKKEENGEVYR